MPSGIIVDRWGGFMNKKRILIVCIIVVLALLFIFLNNNKKEYIFIGNDKCYFGMSKVGVKRVMGKPAEKINNAHDTPFDEYVYVNKTDDGEFEYTFTFFKSRLIEMHITAEDIDYNYALDMVKDSIQKQSDSYSSNLGYYNKGMKTNEGKSFSASNGINNGATGIYFDYEYAQGSLVISAIKQE